MNDAQSSFYSTVKERKAMARCASARKNGSKSRLCTLPSDSLSEKQWKERNGEVIISNLDRPMSYREWKTLSLSQKWAYIEGLYSKHAARTVDIADMFGISQGNIGQVFNRYGVDYKEYARRSEAFKRRSPSQKWKDFIERMTLGPEPVVQPEPEISQEQETAPEPEVVEPTVDAPSVQRLPVRSLGGTLVYEGIPEDVMLELLRHLDPGGSYHMEIRFYPSDMGIET